MEIKLIGYCYRCKRKMIYNCLATDNQSVRAEFICENSSCSNTERTEDDVNFSKLSKTDIRLFRNTELLLDYLRGDNPKKLERKYKRNISSIKRILKESDETLTKSQKDRVCEIIKHEFEFISDMLKPWISRSDLTKFHNITAEVSCKPRFW